MKKLIGTMCLIFSVTANAASICNNTRDKSLEIFTGEVPLYKNLSSGSMLILEYESTFKKCRLKEICYLNVRAKKNTPVGEDVGQFVIQFDTLNKIVKINCFMKHSINYDVSLNNSRAEIRQLR